MKHEPKYLLTTEFNGVFFLNSNDGRYPTITVTASKGVPLTEEEKLAYSDDFQVYGPKLVLLPYKNKSPIKLEGIVEAKKEEANKEVENKLEENNQLPKEDFKKKVIELKKKYSAEPDKKVRKQIKKEIESLLNYNVQGLIMGLAKSLKEKLKSINEMEGVVMVWDRAGKKGSITSGTQSFEVSPELVASFGDEAQALEGLPVDFEVGQVDGQEMVTSITLK